MIPCEALAKSRLSYLTLHKEYEAFSKVIATSNYLLSLSSVVGVEALNIILSMHPIVVIKTKNTQVQRYCCIGGIRSYLVAKSVLNHHDEVPILVLPRARKEDVSLMIYTDLLLSPLLNSVRHLSDIGCIFEQIGPDGIKNILSKGNQSKEALAKKMGCAKNSIFRPKQGGSQMLNEEAGRK